MDFETQLEKLTKELDTNKLELQKHEKLNNEFTSLSKSHEEIKTKLDKIENEKNDLVKSHENSMLNIKKHQQNYKMLKKKIRKSQQNMNLNSRNYKINLRIVFLNPI